MSRRNIELVQQVLFDELGRHPVGRADHSAPLLVGVELGAEAEVGELHLALHADEHVVALDVAVYDVVRVQVVEREQALLGHGGHLRLVHDRLEHDVGERAALQVLHHDPQLFVAQVALDVVDYAPEVHFFHHFTKRSKTKRVVN